MDFLLSSFLLCAPLFVLDNLSCFRDFKNGIHCKRNGQPYTSLTTLLCGFWYVTFRCAIPKPCNQSFIPHYSAVSGLPSRLRGEKQSRQLASYLSSHVTEEPGPLHRAARAFQMQQRKTFPEFSMFYMGQNKSHCQVQKRCSLVPPNVGG